MIGDNFYVLSYYYDDKLVEELLFVDYDKMRIHVSLICNRYRRKRFSNTFRLYVEYFSHGLVVKQYYCSTEVNFHCERSAKVCYDVVDGSGKVLTTVNSHLVGLQLADFYNANLRTYIQCLNTKKRFYYE